MAESATADRNPWQRASAPGAAALPLYEHAEHERVLRRAFREQRRAGRTRVSADQLRRKLGATTVRAWMMLCEVRDKGRWSKHTGEVWAVAALLERMGLCRDEARRVRDRLEEIGLLREAGWMVRRTDGARVRAFYVLGDARVRDGHVTVTREVERAMKASKRGGTRTGAGRPRKGETVEEARARRGLSDGIKVPPSANQNPSPLFLPTEETRFTSLPSGEIRAAADRGQPAGSTSTPTPSGTVLAPPGGFPSVTPVPLLRSRGLLPPFPTVDRVGACLVPGPVKLPADMADDDAVLWIARCYEGASRARGGPPLRLFPRGIHPNARRGSTFRALIGAIPLFREHEIAPAAWVAWSIEKWRALGHSTIPSVSWTFSAKRIHERRGWFRSEEDDLCLGGAVVFAGAFRKLLDKNRALEADVLRSRPRTDDEVRAVVARHFPDDLHAQLEQAAQAEAVEERRKLRDRVAAGEWIW